MFCILGKRDRYIILVFELQLNKNRFCSVLLLHLMNGIMRLGQFVGRRRWRGIKGDKYFATMKLGYGQGGSL